MLRWTHSMSISKKKYIYIFPGAQGDVLASTVMRSHDFNSFKKKKKRLSRSTPDLQPHKYEVLKVIYRKGFISDWTQPQSYRLAASSVNTSNYIHAALKSWPAGHFGADLKIVHHWSLYTVSWQVHFVWVTAGIHITDVTTGQASVE